MEDSQVLKDLIGDIKDWLKACRGLEEPCGVIHLKKGKAKFVLFLNSNLVQIVICTIYQSNIIFIRDICFSEVKWFFLRCPFLAVIQIHMK